ncbi:MAG: STAS-like domain-containing protein [Methylotenera sp.]|nr:STAS-like domain-containing protein [Methylotenera sp.]
MVINILEHVKTASTYEDGEVVYNLIYDALSSGESVVLSFKDITSVPSAFINSALIRLLEVFNFEYIRNRLIIKDTTKHINDLIKSRFEFVVSKK